MRLRRKLLEQLDNISLNEIDIPLAILLFFAIIIIGFKFGKTDDGKTIPSEPLKEFRKDDNEGYI